MYMYSYYRYLILYFKNNEKILSDPSTLVPTNVFGAF